MAEHICLHLDSEPIDQAIGEYRQLVDQIGRDNLPKAIADSLLRITQVPGDLVRVEQDPTLRAGQVFLLLKPAEPFLELLAALRAIKPPDRRPAAAETH